MSTVTVAGSASVSWAKKRPPPSRSDDTTTVGGCGGGTRAGDRVRDLEEEGRGAVAVGDDEDLVVRPRVLERLREPEQARGRAGIAHLGDERFLRHRRREAELPDERSVQPGVGRAED